MRSRTEKRGRAEVDEPDETRDWDEIGDGGKAAAGKPSPDLSPGGRPGSRLADLSDLRAPGRDADLRAASRDAELRVGRDTDLRTSSRDAEVRARSGNNFLSRLLAARAGDGRLASRCRFSIADIHVGFVIIVK